MLSRKVYTYNSESLIEMKNRKCLNITLILYTRHYLFKKLSYFQHFAVLLLINFD